MTGHQNRDSTIGLQAFLANDRTPNNMIVFFFSFCKKNACEHAEGMPQYMASPQCLGYTRYRTVTKDLCFPPRKDILNRTEEAVRNYSAKAVFVATDNDPMIDHLNFRLKGLGVS